MHQKLSKSVNV